MCLAVPGQILSVSADDPLLRSGRVSFDGLVREVALSCVPEAQVGDYVLVHAGLAISIIDEAEASQRCAALESLLRQAADERNA